MSTRGTYSFFDKYNPKGIHVYKHSDNYPTGAAQALTQALTFAWQLPRYEADEFAAAFVTGNKLPHWIDEAFIKFVEDLYEGKLTSTRDKDPMAAFTAPAQKFSFEVEIQGWMMSRQMSGGGVRLIAEKELSDAVSDDCEYRYEVREKDKSLEVIAFSLYGDDKEIFRCDIKYIKEVAAEYENREIEEE